MRNERTHYVREGEPVVYAIEGAANIPHEAAEDIQAILKNKHAGDPFDSFGEDEFDDESHYQEKLVNEDPSWQQEWEISSIRSRQKVAISASR